jgi:glycosyltransferase involved in cell wall biosynthesis
VHNRYRLPGGEEWHLELLEHGLREAGIEVRRFERDSGELKNSSYSHVRTGLGLAYRPGGGGIVKVMRSWKPDVAHFHNIWPLLTPAALRLAKREGAAVAMTLHNYRFACPGGVCPSVDQLGSGDVLNTACISGSAVACALRHNPRSAYFQSLAYGVAIETQRRLHMLDRWVDAFIAPSEFVRFMVERAGLPIERVRVIPHGVHLPSRSFPGGHYGLFAGRLSPEKGIETLLEAVRIANDVPIVVAGEGPLEGISHGPNISFVGKLDRQEMALVLQDALFTVVPSIWHESFGYSALEALAAGKPVIASRVGGLPEIVQEKVNGLLVAPADPTALAEAMRTLWHDRELCAQLGAKARSLVEERFLIDHQLDSTIALYRAIASAPKASR